MLEQMKWEEAYSLWNYNSHYSSEILSLPITPESVFVRYNQEGNIYGFDWFQNEDARERKKLIGKEPAGISAFNAAHK